jgi:predicted nucleotide-binding protein
MELNDKRMEAVTEKIETQNKRDAMETKVIEAKKKNEFIATERGFEEYVRTTYPVVKEGEGVIVVYDDDKTPVSDVREKMTVWERLTVIFQGIFSRKRDTLQEVQ